jgi:hypothetical protein
MQQHFGDVTYAEKRPVNNKEIEGGGGGGGVTSVINGEKVAEGREDARGSSGDGSRIIIKITPNDVRLPGVGNKLENGAVMLQSNFWI